MTLWIAFGALAMAGALGFVMFRRKLPTYRLWPTWPVAETPADTRKWVAMLASFGGAIIMSAGAAALVLLLWKGGWSDGTEAQRIEIFGWSLLALIGGGIAVNIGYGFVITPRKYKLGKEGLEASGGDEGAPVRAAEAVAEAAVEKAEEIKAETPPEYDGPAMPEPKK